eukprot:5907892-Karenia_brevis.AAC.1
MSGKSEKEPEDEDSDEYEEQVARRTVGEEKGLNVVSTSTESRARNCSREFCLHEQWKSDLEGPEDK